MGNEFPGLSPEGQAQILATRKVNSESNGFQVAMHALRAEQDGNNAAHQSKMQTSGQVANSGR